MRFNYGVPAALACMQGDHGLCGNVKFFPISDGTLVVAEICNLPDSKSDFFALHIHEGGDCSGSGYPETGGHYNPYMAMHPKHAGDLPPLLSCNGRAFLSVMTNRFQVKDIIGKTVVIHSRSDDFRTQPSGDAGEKIACGIIQCL